MCFELVPVRFQCQAFLLVDGGEAAGVCQPPGGMGQLRGAGGAVPQSVRATAVPGRPAGHFQTHAAQGQ